MKTVKVETIGSKKNECQNFASVINDMPRVKSEKLQMTALQEEGLNANKKIVEQYDAQKKLQQTFTKLKQNLEACREAKPDVSDNLKDLQAIRYFESLEKDMLSTISSMKERGQQKILTLKQKMEEETLKRQQQIERELEWQKTQLEREEKKIRGVQERLHNARERAKTKNKKTKEEIKLEKQLQQLLIDFKKTNPDKDTEYYFPGYKTLLGYTPVSPSTFDPPSNETDKNTIVVPEEDEEEEEEEEEETEEERIANALQRSEYSPWIKWVLCNSKRLSTYELYHQAIANGITPEIPEPPNPNPPKKPIEDDITLWNKMTPWQRFVKQNPKKTQYALYQEALEMGIEPDIPEPPNPKSTHANKTVSRESLAKVIPGFN